MPDEDEKQRLCRLGFRFGANGPHAARSMMVADIGMLCSRLPHHADRAAYAREVLELNSLDKPTRSARKLALRHLTTLYGLDPGLAVFRAFRRLWAFDESARPVLALFIALARDPLLRSTQDFIRTKRPGETVSRQDLEQVLSQRYPDRFSRACLRSFAQNINGTWTQAGYLAGRVQKTRLSPIVRPANVAFGLLLGHLEGLSGQRLFTSSWMALLDGLPADLEAQALSASHSGLLVFMNAGGVKEVRFPGYLTTAGDARRAEPEVV